MHKSSLLMALVGLLATSSLAAEPIVNIVDRDGLALGKRQQNTQSSESTPPVSSTPPAPSRTSTSSSPAPAPTTTTPAAPTTTRVSSTPSSRPITSSTPPPPPPETSDRESTTSPDRPTTSTQPSSRSTVTSIPIVTSRTSVRTTVITVTRGDGSAVASEVISSAVVQETIGSQVTTIPIPHDSGGGSNSGLSEGSKKIIAGVVGGVGGAILLGGLALVAWRMWGRKKTETEDYDDIRSGGGSDSLQAEKRQSATPFQSTLDQYHTPAPKPNAAANF